MTARQAFVAARQRLLAAGHQDGEAVARVLLEEALSLSPAALLAAYDRELPLGAQTRLNGWFDRVLAGEPVQYVLGHWAFYGREFRCDPRALIPRTDTETLVEAALQRGPLGPARVLDIGCGTGCVGITLALERPHWQVTLVDISPDALALARENAAALGASAELRQADLFAALPGGPYDMIVSNPPYISAGEYDALEPVVRENEPRLALLGGSDGLQHLRALAQRAGESLRPGGILLAEVGWRQSAAVQAIFTEALGNAGAIRDLNGIERVIVSRKG